MLKGSNLITGINYIILLILVCSVKSFAGGFSAWQKESPYGHNMEHDGAAGGWVCMDLDTNRLCFQSFYFYKGYTIAQSVDRYYIINESKESFQQFTDKKQWRLAIKQQNLKPLFQRSYDSNYSGFLSDDLTLFIVFFPLPLFFPLLWLCCAASLLLPWSWGIGFRKHFTWIYPVVIIILLIYNDLPQSF